MISSRKKILVLSPHLDDAVLSCGDHILEWKRQGHEVTIVSIFTMFQDKYISKGAQDSLKAGGFKNAKECERARKIEDIEVMKTLSVKYCHLDFIDGWFRVRNNRPIYTDGELFKGRISNYDIPLMGNLKRLFSQYDTFDRIVIPKSVGKHVDHLITYEVAQKIFANYKLFYYGDYPYLLNRYNISVRLAWQFITHFYSMKRMSPTKKKLLQSYVSQIPQLFNTIPNYFEIVMH